MQSTSIWHPYLRDLNDDPVSRLDYALKNKLTPFISMQNHYNLVYREEEREMFPTLKHFGVGSIPWSPLARGLLTRPIDAASKRGNTDWYVLPLLRVHTDIPLQ